MGFFLVVILGICGTASSLATCFTPNGTDRNAIAGSTSYLPCDSTAEFSMCCQLVQGKPDVCKPGGWCYNQNTNTWWRESCTDKTWKSPACNKLFVNGTGLAGTGTIVYYRPDIPTNDVPITPCDNGSWCYGAGNIECCRQGKGVFINNGTQTTQNPNASSSLSPIPTSNQAPTPSSSPTPSAAASITNGGLSTGAKAGIGVGVALGSLLVIALLVFLLRRNKRTSKQSKTAPGEHPFEKPELPTNSPAYKPLQQAPTPDPIYEIDGSHPSNGHTGESSRV